MSGLPIGGITQDFVNAVVTMVENLPLWARDKAGTILIAKECLVHWIPEEFIDIKIVRCNNCGECCMTFPDVIYGDDEEGKCNALYHEDDKWLCRAGIEKPYACMQDPIEGQEKNCVIEHWRISLK